MDLLEKLEALPDKITDGNIDNVTPDKVFLQGTFSYEALKVILDEMRPASK